ncbi:hypothetical protein EBZ80_20080 [bacterium]|nr:hypothetical protein [bacterium]
MSSTSSLSDAASSLLAPLSKEDFSLVSFVRVLERNDGLPEGVHLAYPCRSKIWHHGIYSGRRASEDYVIHILNDGQGVREDTLEDFLEKTDRVCIVKYEDDSSIHLTESIGRAREALSWQETDARRIYDILGNNCEHFATYCRTGRCVPMLFHLLPSTGVVGLTRKDRCLLSVLPPTRSAHYYSHSRFSTQ